MRRNAAKCTLAFFGRRDLERRGGAREGQIFLRPCAASTTGHCVLEACYASGHSCYRASDYRSLQPRHHVSSGRKPSALPLHSGTLKSSVADSPPRYGSPQIAVDSALSLHSGRSMCQRCSEAQQSAQYITLLRRVDTAVDSVAEQGQAATAAAPLKTTEPLQSVECTEVVWHRDTSALSACEIPVALLGRLRWLGAIGITGAQVVCVLWPRCLSRSTILMHQWLDIVAAACAEPAR